MGQTDAVDRPYHRPCSTYCAGSVNGIEYEASSKLSFYSSTLNDYHWPGDRHGMSQRDFTSNNNCTAITVSIIDERVR